jgi:predicted nuclease of restriction endonuclease-like (RecB) superfamily
MKSPQFLSTTISGAVDRWVIGAQTIGPHSGAADRVGAPITIFVSSDLTPRPVSSLDMPKKTKQAAVARAKASVSGPRRQPTSLASAAPGGVGPLLERVVSILEQARSQVVRSVNSAMVLAYWQIGREIVEYHQGGAGRAEYGDRVLALLSQRLQVQVGRGYSVTNIKYFRLFYQAYADREPKIRHEARDELPGRAVKGHEGRDVSKALSLAARSGGLLEGFSSRLSWTHYRTLTKVDDPAARAFYEIEASLADWSVPHLERQIHTHLFARLLKSRNKQGVMDLATRGQVLEKPVDAIKHPMVLDFLDLPDSAMLRESDLESAILGKLSHFLLKLGKGFAFVARQKRLSFEDEHFYVDLVFYNVILKCYLLIDLKLGKLAHQDVGQMDSYVRLFDAQGRTAGDGPTIGLVLCAEKNEAVARYSVLHENKQLFAAKYVTYLPSVEELQRELARERRLLEVNDGDATVAAKKRAPSPRRGPRARTRRPNE